MTDSPHTSSASRRLRIPAWGYLVAIVVTAVLTFALTALLLNIFERKQEGRVPFVRVVEVDEATTDPAPWSRNWPREHDSYQRTVDVTKTRYGGSEAMPAQKLKQDPWLKRLYAGYAFSIDYRTRRGHAYMLYDQEHTERVLKKPQPGACLHCHASVVPTWRRLGLEAMNQPATPEVLARDFNWPAVMKGFELASAMTYQQAHDELVKTSDGTPGDEPRPHPVSCVDCHDPRTMASRVTRPGFMRGIQALAASAVPTPHLPSIERWRSGDRKAPYDPNVDATRQEMRSFVCGQCHVEYYCGPKETLFFPWAKGLRADQIEEQLAAHTFPDGSPFHDYKHAETGALSFKAQHPEFELWSQGIHARAGVACADCHMPYLREGAMKVSDHWVRSPLLNINNACQTCHNVGEPELLARAQTIQDRTQAMLQRSATAMTDMLDAINAARAAGVGDDRLAPVLTMQRSAMWRLDFVSSENSVGFHADQEAARLLAESIDLSRQATVAALTLRAGGALPPPAPPPGQPAAGSAPATQPSTQPAVPPKGITPRPDPGPKQ